MKEKSDKPSPAKKAAKTATKAASKTAAPVAKKAATKEAKAPASKKVAKPAAEKKPASAPKSTAVSKSTEPDLSRNAVATAAYLNWCQRRNQGLPDDPMADWIAAESGMGLAN